MKWIYAPIKKLFYLKFNHFISLIGSYFCPKILKSLLNLNLFLSKYAENEDKLIFKFLYSIAKLVCTPQCMIWKVSSSSFQVQGYQFRFFCMSLNFWSVLIFWGCLTLNKQEVSIIIEFCFLSNPSCWAGARGGLLPLLLHFIHNRIYGVWILIFLRSWIWNQRFLHRFYSYFSDHSSAAHKSEPICISPSDTVDKSHLKKSHIYLASFCKQLKMTQFFQIRMVSKSIIMGNCRASGIRENGRFLTFWNEKKCKTWIY